MDYGARWNAVDPSAESYFAYNPFVYAIDNPIRVIDPDGKDIYFAIQGNRLVYLGDDKQGDRIRIGNLGNSKAVKQYRKMIRKTRKGKGTDSYNKALRGDDSPFVSAEVQNESEQGQLIDNLRTFSEMTDGQEVGRLLVLDFDRKNRSAQFRFSDDIFLGNKDNVKFKMRGGNANSEGLLDSEGNFVIGTVHTHKHDRGLSGSGLGDEKSGGGDARATIVTGVPWYTVGPKKIHRGTANIQGQFSQAEIKTKNLLLDAIKQKMR